MKRLMGLLLVLGILLPLNTFLLGATEREMAFTLRIGDKAGNFHVDLNCKGFKGEIFDFKMPVFTPGYYRILDFAAGVNNFSARDSNGNKLPWEKISKNSWRVATGNTESFMVSYDVKSNNDSVATSFMDENRAYINGPSIFMYPEEGLKNGVSVSLILPPNIKVVSTGLKKINDKGNTYYGEDFDTLYDCPIYAGSQDVISFEVQGIKHYIAMENPGNFNREEMLKGFKKMTETAIALMGEIPYGDYTYIFMGEGRGGLEHMNSTAVFLAASGDKSPWSDKRIMKFLTHEYFHLFNVKRIRPIGLGPFNYDKESITDMLWFSEGGTVYYEYMILNRAGFLSGKECLEEFSRIISDNENNGAHRTQSVGEASEKAWTQSFFGNENEVSYYDKGFILSMFLDLKIRYETKNKKSLDDVMRTCYYEFHKKLKRGFTDKEFQDVCEKIAGTSLSDFFGYVNGTGELDYEKYLGYGGMKLERPTEGVKGHFRIIIISTLTALQNEILGSWLKD